LKLSNQTFVLGSKPTKTQRRLLWCEGKHLKTPTSGDAMYGRPKN